MPRPYTSHEPRLGLENACSPVFIWSAAPVWLMLSACIERITQRSSACLDRHGNSSLISVPHSPCLLNFQGEASRLPVCVRKSFGFAKGKGWPFIAASFGLGSKRSTCDGPPGMYKKTQRFAVAA